MHCKNQHCIGFIRTVTKYHSVFNHLLCQIKTSRFSAAAAKSLQSCPTLCDPIDGSPSGSTIPGIRQARILEWVAISFSNAWQWKVKVKSLSLVWLFADPMDCSLPGSSVRGIFQARVLEWGVIAFSSSITRESVLPQRKIPHDTVKSHN